MALAASLVTTSAHAFEIKHAEGGALVRWRRPAVAWTVDSSVKELPGAYAAVTAAIAAWTQQAGAPKLALAKEGAPLKPGLDGANGIFYVKDGYAPAGEALAITVLSFDDRSGEVLDADIILNGKYELGRVNAALPTPTAAKDPGAATYDVGRVLAHEMGHALALSDEPERKDALMYPYVARARALRAAPGSDDLAGLETLYADAASAEPIAGEGCAAAGARPRAGAAWCALGVGGAALLLARKRKAAAGFTTLAAVVMLAPVSASASTTTTTTDSESVVTSVSTTDHDGIFRSEIAVTDGVVVSRHVAWGGTVDGVRQVVGGARVPRAGDRVRIVLASPALGEPPVARLVLRSAE